MIKKCICLLAAALMFTACTSDDDKETKVQSTETVIDTNKIKDSEASDVEKSEQLALAGEQLMTPGSFFYADKIFDEALNYDKSNLRARFYKALNAPMMGLKGIYTRIEPLVMKDTKKSIVDYKKSINESKYDVAVREFLFDGEKDIDTEAKAQEYINTQVEAYDELRKFFKDNKDMNLKINFPELAWREVDGDRLIVCKTRETHHGTFVRECKVDFKAFTATIERADAEALQHISAGMVIYYSLLTAYDFTGFQQASLAFRTKNNMKIQGTDKALFDEAKKHQSLGLLNSDHKLGEFISLGSDALAGVRWAQKIQDKLCPEVIGQRVSVNNYGYSQALDIRRQGKVFEDGLCIPEKTSKGKSVDKLLKSVELAFAGNVMTLTGYESRTGKKVETLVNYSNLVENPVADLKSLPKSFNECGDLESITDDSLNGVFVNHDASEFGKAIGSLDENNCEAPL